MKDYFKTKVGQKITKTVCTGVSFFTDVYKRQYNIEILGIKGNKLHVYVTSFDIVPSGYKEGDSDIEHGDLILDIKNLNTLDAIYNEIICRIDIKFVTKYPQVLKKKAI